MRKSIFYIVLLFIIASCSQGKKSNSEADVTWYKGNTHCHTTISDGDTLPEDVIKWYHDHAYNFLLVSDHNVFIPIEEFKLPENKREDFILIPSEEVTDGQAVHTTAMNVKGYVAPGRDKRYDNNERIRSMNQTQLFQMHVDSITAKGGIVFANHINWSKGVQPEVLMKVKGLTHLEVYNGHSGVKNWGKEGHLPVEDKWDIMLSKGYYLRGVAADDAHDYGDISLDECNPGRGWIMVKSKVLTTDAITEAVARGDFYATMGVTLSELKYSDNTWSIKVDDERTKKEIGWSNTSPRVDETGTQGYLIEFIGLNGKVLKSVEGTEAEFKADKSAKYVRARVTLCRKTAKGYEKHFAWTQPQILDKEFFTNL